jgi:hypothetical protein
VSSPRALAEEIVALASKGWRSSDEYEEFVYRFAPIVSRAYIDLLEAAKDLTDAFGPIEGVPGGTWEKFKAALTAAEEGDPVSETMDARGPDVYGGWFRSTSGVDLRVYGEGSAVQTSVCGYCGEHHTMVCPRIQEIEYHQNGTVKRVVLRPVTP